MKKEMIYKIGETVCNTMFTLCKHLDKVAVDFQKAHKCGLASSISNVIMYIETMKTGHKEDIIISYTEYDNAINIYITSHDDNYMCKGYSYRFCVRTDKKNQIEVTAELFMALNMTLKEIQ